MSATGATAARSCLRWLAGMVALAAAVPTPLPVSGASLAAAKVASAATGTSRAKITPLHTNAVTRRRSARHSQCHLAPTLPLPLHPHRRRRLFFLTAAQRASLSTIVAWTKMMATEASRAASLPGKRSVNLTPCVEQLLPPSSPSGQRPPFHSYFRRTPPRSRKRCTCIRIFQP